MSTKNNQYKTCSFFGHRKINTNKNFELKLKKIIEDLIINHNVQRFLFGSRSDFDDLCHLVVTELKTSYPNIKRVAFPCKHESCILESEREKWEKIYSNFWGYEVKLLGVEEEAQHKTKYTAGRASYVERNQAMINNSDYCVFYYNESIKPINTKQNLGYRIPNSGTALAYKYANQKKKNLINTFNL